MNKKSKKVINSIKFSDFTEVITKTEEIKHKFYLTDLCLIAEPISAKGKTICLLRDKQGDFIYKNEADLGYILYKRYKETKKDSVVNAINFSSLHFDNIEQKTLYNHIISMLLKK